MRITYSTKHDPVTQLFEDHAEPRLTALEHYSSRITEADVTLAFQRGRHTVDITLDVDGHILRGEARDSDLLAAFDATLDKIQRQLERFKGRFNPKHRRGVKSVPVAETEIVAEEEEVVPEPEEDELGLEDINIVRTKAHMLKPMTAKEAAVQMEMLGHDFYVFFDGQTERVHVVYRRNDGDYGLIEPEVG